MKHAPALVVFAVGISCASSGPPPQPTAPSPAPVPAASAPPEPAPEPAPLAIPDTPAGQTFAAWLDAFNSGDDARMEAFAARHKHAIDPKFRAMTGGFEVVSVEASEPLRLTVVVQEKARPAKAVAWLTVRDAQPAEVESFQVALIPPGKTAADMDVKLDAAARARVVDAIAARLAELYVFPEVAAKMEQALREHQAQGAYDKVVSGRAFAQLLTQHLRAVSQDKHLWVKFQAQVIPQGAGGEPSDEQKAKFRQQLESINCGFEKAERLDGNIGYVKFDMFGDAEVCGPRATAALASLGDVDALVFDLRENGGGEPAMVAFVSSYLFAKRTHLNDLFDRKANKTTQYWTKPEVPGRKFAKQPVYVLTSSKTFSGAEEFTYNLKNLKRATIIGETTGGGAHPTTGQRVDDHFMIGVPFARAINPITRTNWEGTGVTPDVAVPAAAALDTARQLAAEQLAKQKRKK